MEEGTQVTNVTVPKSELRKHTAVATAIAKRGGNKQNNVGLPQRERHDDNRDDNELP